MMKKQLSLLLLSCSLAGPVRAAKTPPAAENKYPVAAIAPTLLEGASTVLRRYEMVYAVSNPGEAVARVFYAVTILNEKGKDEASLQVPYDKLAKVNYVRGAVYDANGFQLDKLSKSDIQDVSAYDGFSMVSDNRMKTVRFSRPQYPYTVEFEYELLDRNLMGYPIWSPQSSADMAVERANFQVVMPANLQLRYKERNLSKAVNTTAEGDKIIYNWEVTDVKAFEREPFGPPSSASKPMVITAPTQFEVEGYAGDMSTWKGLGLWQNQLNAGRDQLPEALKQKLVQLTAGEKDPLVKIRKVYEYLQSSTRYVSIQLGIGGWQPFDATTVNKNGYGDCKALSNYTKAMLQAVGVEAYYTLIRAGESEEDIQTDFPSRQFNHAVLFVPLAKDTIWLECTDQNAPLGYAGSFTGNRHALAITPEGGKLVRTPQYRAEDSRAIQTGDFRIDANGDATAELLRIFTGLQQDDRSMWLQLETEEQKKRLYKDVDIPSFDITEFKLSQQKNRIPSFTEKLKLNVRKCVSKSGKRVFLTLNQLSALTAVPPKVENRRTPVVIREAFVDSDTIRYHLPQGFAVEFQPEPVQIKSIFGEYSASVKVENGVLTYIRQHRMERSQYPATSYNELIEFFKKIAKADRMQVVLLNSSLAEK